MLRDDTFSAEFFMVWLLPPIIFAAGFNLNIPAFVASIVPTMLLAFVGTVLSSAAVRSARRRADLVISLYMPSCSKYSWMHLPPRASTEGWRRAGGCAGEWAV